MSVLEAPVRRAKPAHRTDLKDRRLLLMVRDGDAAARYQHLFKLFGAMVIPVFSAAELLAGLRAEQPDAVAYDLDMIEGDLHLIRRIRMRSRLDGGATPALALTAALPALTRRRCWPAFRAT